MPGVFAIEEIAGRLEAELAAAERARAELSSELQRQTRRVSEQQLLLAETNHRTKNALTVAVSLLRQQHGRLADPQARKALAAAIGRLT